MDEKKYICPICKQEMVVRKLLVPKDLLLAVGEWKIPLKEKDCGTVYFVSCDYCFEGCGKYFIEDSEEKAVEKYNKERGA